MNKMNKKGNFERKSAIKRLKDFGSFLFSGQISVPWDSIPIPTEDW